MSIVINNVLLPKCSKANSVSVTSRDGVLNNYNGKSGSNINYVLDFCDKVIAFPGIINSHDHLDFNNLPLLKSHEYDDYEEWAKDIHENKKFRDIITKSNKIPYHMKIKTGLIKNVVCGVTTVVNHGRKINKFFEGIDVYEQCKILHSEKYEKWLPVKLNFSNGVVPIAIHLGEGKTDSMRKEIDRVLNYNLFNKKIIGIHGISIDTNQAKKIRALVWCPESNHQLYGKTAPVDEIKKSTTILFGTDSTLSADWNIWKHLRIARKLKYLCDEELFYTLNRNAADVWGMALADNICSGYSSDIVLAKCTRNNYWDSLYILEPEDILLVIKKGKIVFFDESVFNMLDGKVPEEINWGKIRVQNSVKYIPASLIDGFGEGYVFNIMPVEILKSKIH